LKRIGTFKNLFQNNEEELQLLNSLQKLIFNQQTAAPQKVQLGPPSCYATVVCPTLSFQMKDRSLYQNQSNTFSKLFLLKWLLLWLQILCVPLNNGVKPLRNPHRLSAGIDSLYLQFKPAIRALNYSRKHINFTTPLQGRDILTQCRHTEEHPFY